MNGGLLERYLDELQRWLWLPPARIRRVLAEAEDHLREAAAQYVAAGMEPYQAERRAVNDFGTVNRVARRFAAGEGHTFPPFAAC